MLPWCPGWVPASELSYAWVTSVGTWTWQIRPSRRFCLLRVKTWILQFLSEADFMYLSIRKPVNPDKTAGAAAATHTCSRRAGRDPWGARRPLCPHGARRAAGLSPRADTGRRTRWCPPPRGTPCLCWCSTPSPALHTQTTKQTRLKHGSCPQRRYVNNTDALRLFPDADVWWQISFLHSGIGQNKSLKQV